MFFHYKLDCIFRWLLCTFEFSSVGYMSVLTSKKGKTKPMVKLDIQLRQPATVYAAGR